MTLQQFFDLIFYMYREITIMLFSIEFGTNLTVMGLILSMIVVYVVIKYFVVRR